MAALRVKVIKKFYDKDEKLIGYGLQSETGETKTVYKDQLKKAIASGAVICVNMTMTSDGRLIGKAMPNPKKPRSIAQPVAPQPVPHPQPVPQPSKPLPPVMESQPVEPQVEPQPVKPVAEQPDVSTQKSSGIKVKAIITNGKKIGGAILDETEYRQKLNITSIKPLKEMQANQSFDTGIDTEEKIKKGWYDNISIVDGKIDFSNTKKISYSKVKEKLLKMLAANNIQVDFKVEKSTSSQKYRYTISIVDYDVFGDLDEIVQAIYVLIENEMIIAKNKVLYFGDDGTVEVECITGINDVRKALKDIRVKAK